MTPDLLLSVVGLAVVDSLNPSLFLAQFFLLTTPQPTARTLSYIAGILVVNVVGGLLILAGLTELVGDAVARLSSTVLYGLGLAVGVALIGYGLSLRTGTGATVEARKPRTLRPIHTFVLGMAVMLNEITTALPYFAALERIAQANVRVGGEIALVALYNAVFSLPLLGFLALFLVYRERFAGQVQRISDAIQVWTPRILKYGSIAFGGALALNAGVFFATGQGLM